jgi:catechol 2,3-dioxygenase-like lactoylglutathione lyase family enzyme
VTEAAPASRSDESCQVSRILRFSLTCAAANTLCHFYEQALGFQRIAARRRSGAAFEQLMGVSGGATCLAMALGDEDVELLQFDSPGRSYPVRASSADLHFQHLAIVVADMTAAYRHLLKVKGWTAISTEGPVLLPETSGGVTAFKFRDPEGHPLELLAFPTHRAPLRWQAATYPGLFLGILPSTVSWDCASAPRA